MEKQPQIKVTVDAKDVVDKFDEIIQKVNELEKALRNLNILNTEVEFEVD